MFCFSQTDRILLLLLQTGAMMISLGQGIAGAFTPSDALADQLKTASSHVGAHNFILRAPEYF